MIITEFKGNLFNSSDSLAHCVSRDFHMSAGIAKDFKYLFGHPNLLRSGAWQVGDAARVIDNDRFIFYLVTKQCCLDKPSEASLELSLIHLAKWCELLSISNLSMPRIAAGRDGLKWENVTIIIKRVFRALNISISVYVQ